MFTVARDRDHLILTGPCGAAPWLIEAGNVEHPLDTVQRIVERSIPEPVLLHSTSWRFERGALYLTFVTVIDRDAVGDMETSDLAGDARSQHRPHRA